LVCFRLREGDAATLVNGRHLSTHGSRGIRSIYRVRGPQISLARTKILHAPVPTIPASGFHSNEFRFGSLVAPLGSELAMALKVEHENRTRLSQSGFRSPSARHRTSSDGGLCGGKLQWLRRRRTPRRGRNDRGLQPNVFSYRRIKPPRVYIDQYFARKEISRQESSGYRNVAITARAHRRNG